MHQVIISHSQPLTDLIEAQVPYGWMTFSVLHQTSCCRCAHIVELGIQTVHIHRMWLYSVLILLVVSHTVVMNARRRESSL